MRLNKKYNNLLILNLLNNQYLNTILFVEKTLYHFEFFAILFLK